MSFDKKTVRIWILVFIFLLQITATKGYSNGLERNDLISYGFRLVVDGHTVEVHTEENDAIRILFHPDNIKPIGLYDRMIGIKIGIPYNFQIPPEEGFDPSDPEYGAIAGKTLYFYDVEVYEVEGVDPNGNQNNSPNNLLAIILGTVLGIAGLVAVTYLSYRFGPSIFAKRCSVCKSKAVGRCKICEQKFCNSCYSTGCPNCKGRTLIRF